MLATWLSTFFSMADDILFLRYLDRTEEEWASFFPEFSCSHWPASTSCLVVPPILPAWLLANQHFFKHNWQNTELSLSTSSSFFFKKKTGTSIVDFFLNVGIVFQVTSCYLGMLIILWGPKENLELWSSPDCSILWDLIISSISLVFVLDIELRYLWPSVPTADFPGDLPWSNLIFLKLEWIHRLSFLGETKAKSLLQSNILFDFNCEVQVFS